MRYHVVIEQCGDGSVSAIARASRTIAKRLGCNAGKLVEALAEDGGYVVARGLTPEQAGEWLRFLNRAGVRAAVSESMQAPCRLPFVGEQDFAGAQGTGARVNGALPRAISDTPTSQIRQGRYPRLESDLEIPFDDGSGCVSRRADTEY